MKYIHFPTLAIHALLLLLAQLTIRDHQDGFLLAAVAVLLAHIIWSAVSRRPIAAAHAACSAVQLAVLALGLIPTGSAPLSTGSELALFFYQIALGVSCVFEAAAALLKRKKA